MQVIEANIGDTIEMMVDRQKSYVKWMVNDKEIGSWETEGWNIGLETMLP